MPEAAFRLGSHVRGLRSSEYSKGANFRSESSIFNDKQLVAEDQESTLCRTLEFQSHGILILSFNLRLCHERAIAGSSETGFHNANPIWQQLLGL